MVRLGVPVFPKGQPLRGIGRKPAIDAQNSAEILTAVRKTTGLEAGGGIKPRSAHGRIFPQMKSTAIPHLFRQKKWRIFEIPSNPVGILKHGEGVTYQGKMYYVRGKKRRHSTPGVLRLTSK